MEINHKILNSKILRKINRVKRLSDRYKEMAEYRLRQISYDKPVGLNIREQKITVCFQYTFENFQTINEAIIKRFDKLDSLSSLKRLVESENILDHQGWYRVGLIFPQNSTDWRSTISAIKIKKFPKHTTIISCSIHRIFPSTSFLCFEFFLDDSFQYDLYKNFYSEQDVSVISDLSLRRTSIQASSSSDKFNDALNRKKEYFENWILDFLKIDKNLILSMNSIFETSLKKICPKRLTKELVQRNFSFFHSQSFLINSINCFSNNEGEYYYIENLQDIRVFKFENDQETNKFENLYNDLNASLMVLISIDTYKKELEIIRENNLKMKKKSDLLKIKDQILISNKLDFQINRLFQEIQLYSENNFLFLILKKYDLKTNSFHNVKYDAVVKNKIEFYSKLLVENSKSLNKLLEIEFNSLTTETNYLLQKRMKWLTIATVLLTLASLIITILNTDPIKLKESLNSLSRIL